MTARTTRTWAESSISVTVAVRAAAAIIHRGTVVRASLRLNGQSPQPFYVPKTKRGAEGAPQLPKRS
jgi:hypothetical protein